MILSTEIELNENDCEENTFTLTAKKDGVDWLFRAQENCENGRSFYYELLEKFSNLKKSSVFRDEILTYCLGRYTKDDEVTLKDVFLHGGYIKRYK